MSLRTGDIPAASLITKLYEDSTRAAVHQQHLLEMRSATDTGKGKKDYQFLKLKLKRKELDADRLKVVDRENKSLGERLNYHANHDVWTKRLFNEAEFVQDHPGTLNVTARKEEARLIQQENERMYQRLLGRSARSEYNKTAIQPKHFHAAHLFENKNRTYLPRLHQEQMKKLSINGENGKTPVHPLYMRPNTCEPKVDCHKNKGLADLLKELAETHQEQLAKDLDQYHETQLQLSSRSAPAMSSEKSESVFPEEENDLELTSGYGSSIQSRGRSAHTQLSRSSYLPSPSLRMLLEQCQTEQMLRKSSVHSEDWMLRSSEVLPSRGCSTAPAGYLLETFSSREPFQRVPEEVDPEFSHRTCAGCHPAAQQMHSLSCKWRDSSIASKVALLEEEEDEQDLSSFCGDSQIRRSSIEGSLNQAEQIYNRMSVKEAAIRAGEVYARGIDQRPGAHPLPSRPETRPTQKQWSRPYPSLKTAVGFS